MGLAVGPCSGLPPRAVGVWDPRMPRSPPPGGPGPLEGSGRGTFSTWGQVSAELAQAWRHLTARLWRKAQASEAPGPAGCPPASCLPSSRTSLQELGTGRPGWGRTAHQEQTAAGTGDCPEGSCAGRRAPASFRTKATAVEAWPEKKGGDCGCPDVPVAGRPVQPLALLSCQDPATEVPRWLPPALIPPALAWKAPAPLPGPLCPCSCLPRVPALPEQEWPGARPVPGPTPLLMALPRPLMSLSCSRA